MAHIPDDIDESARLVFMLLPGLKRFSEFVAQMRELHPGISTLTVTEVWIRYMGLDGRGRTHDIETGLPLNKMRGF